MKNGKVVVTVLVIAVILIAAWFVSQANKKSKIKEAALAAGASPAVATAVSNSSDPASALRSLGLNDFSATQISNGTSPTSNRLVYVSTGTLNSCPIGNFVIGPNPDGTYDCYKQVPNVA